MKFSTGLAYGVVMKTPFTEKIIVTYATESEAIEEATKAQKRVRESGYTDVYYSVSKVGA